MARGARLWASAIAASIWVLLDLAYWAVALALLGWSGRRAASDVSPFLPEADPVLVLGGAFAIGAVFVAVALGMHAERLRDWRSALVVAGGTVSVIILQAILPGLYLGIVLAAIATLALARSSLRTERGSGRPQDSGA